MTGRLRRERTLPATTEVPAPSSADCRMPPSRQCFRPRGFNAFVNHRRPTWPRSMRSWESVRGPEKGGGESHGRMDQPKKELTTQKVKLRLMAPSAASPAACDAGLAPRRSPIPRSSRASWTKRTAPWNFAMTDRDLELRLLTACAVAREAGRLAYDYFTRRAELDVEHKSGAQDLVSIADREVEELIRTRLWRRVPRRPHARRRRRRRRRSARR